MCVREKERERKDIYSINPVKRKSHSQPFVPSTLLLPHRPSNSPWSFPHIQRHNVPSARNNDLNPFTAYDVRAYISSKIILAITDAVHTHQGKSLTCERRIRLNSAVRISLYFINPPQRNTIKQRTILAIQRALLNWSAKGLSDFNYSHRGESCGASMRAIAGNVRNQRVEICSKCYPDCNNRISRSREMPFSRPRVVRFSVLHIYAYAIDDRINNNNSDYNDIASAGSTMHMKIHGSPLPAASLDDDDAHLSPSLSQRL